jgi:putative ABC transport system ATP-binding protein
VTETLTSTVLETAAASATELVKVYGGNGVEVRALDGISVAFASGRFNAILGPSGSGKSTLLHCLAGLDSVTSGTVSVGGEDIAALSEHKLTRLRRDRIGFVFQSFNLVPTLSVSENVKLPIRLAGRRADRDWFDFIVEAVGLHDRLDHRPSELSGGEQQRVAIARALVTRPDIIFADEPTGNLDTQTGASVLGMLRKAVDDFGQSIVMVTHDPGAASYADRATFLVDGRVATELADPTPGSVLDTMKELEG